MDELCIVIKKCFSLFARCTSSRLYCKYVTMSTIKACITSHNHVILEDCTHTHRLYAKSARNYTSETRHITYTSVVGRKEAEKTQMVPGGRVRGEFFALFAISNQSEWKLVTQNTLSIVVYKGHVKNETSPSLSRICRRHCFIYDVIASLLLNKAPKI